MFKKMLNWLQGLLSRAFGPEINTAPAVMLSGDMVAAIDLWARMYSEVRNTLGLPASIASEFARLVTLEADITIEGSPRADFIAEQFRPVRKRLRQYVEYGAGLGNFIFKPYVSDGKIIIDGVQGDCFYPLSFDTSNRMTGVMFVEQLVRGKNIYTRFEWHQFTPQKYEIKNAAFVSTTIESIGKPIPLTDVPEWADLVPEAVITGTDRPWFAFFRIPAANPIDRHSSLGVSVFARAVELIKDADEQYARFKWEFEGSELAVDAAEDYLLNYEGEAPRLPKTKERLFRKLASKDQNFYEVFSPQIRDESQRKGLNEILKRIEFNCALAYGTLSDPQNVDKTAEEIKTSKQRSYTSVFEIQKALEDALNDLFYVLDNMATVYKLAPAGKVYVSYAWDDSLIVDLEKERAQMRQDCRDGAAQWWEYRMRFYGEDEETAKAMVSQMSTPDEILFGSK